MTLPEETHDKSVKSFVGHLLDLRATVIRVAAFIFGGIIIVIPFAPTILEWLKIPYYRAKLDTVVPLQINDVSGGLSIAMCVIIWSGLLVSLPFVVLSIGSFIFPGLKPNEKKAIIRGAGFSIALFICGVAMGFVWTVPVALKVMSSIGNWMGTPSAFWNTTGYVIFVLKILIAFGLTFQMPVILLVLGNMGIVKSKMLREKRRHVIVGLMVLSMFMTPSDPFTMIMMATPLILLYEACIWMIWAKERGGKETMNDKR